MAVTGAPTTREDLARELGAAGAAGEPVRLLGGGTKLSWGAAGAEHPSELSTAGLESIVEHNAGDLTAVVEAGVPLASLQATLGEAEQMLSLDPPDEGATIGGVVATADSGPLRSRYGGVRDLVVGMRVALSDGTLAKSGGKVIKNVAGYDLAKLFAGSFGTLGAIVEVAVRLHPVPPATMTAMGSTNVAHTLGQALISLSRAPLEHHGFDLRWSASSGALLVRFAGASPRPQAENAERLMEEAGLETELVEDDETLWAEQRSAQRAAGQDAIVRVSGLPAQLPALVGLCERLGGSVVGRAPLGLSWLRVPAAEAGAIEELRRELSPSPCVVLDRPGGLDVDPWGPVDPGALTVMRRLKERFDPAGVCNPGAFAGGL